MCVKVAGIEWGGMGHKLFLSPIWRGGGVGKIYLVRLGG